MPTPPSYAKPVVAARVLPIYRTSHTRGLTASATATVVSLRAAAAAHGGAALQSEMAHTQAPSACCHAHAPHTGTHSFFYRSFTDQGARDTHTHIDAHRLTHSLHSFDPDSASKHPRLPQFP